MSCVEVYKQFKGKVVESIKESWSSAEILFTDGTRVVVTAVEGTIVEGTIVEGPIVDVWVEEWIKEWLEE